MTQELLDKLSGSEAIQSELIRAHRSCGDNGYSDEQKKAILSLVTRLNDSVPSIPFYDGDTFDAIDEICKLDVKKVVPSIDPKTDGIDINTKTTTQISNRESSGYFSYDDIYPDVVNNIDSEDKSHEFNQESDLILNDDSLSEQYNKIKNEVMASIPNSLDFRWVTNQKYKEELDEENKLREEILNKLDEKAPINEINRLVNEFKSFQENVKLRRHEEDKPYDKDNQDKIKVALNNVVNSMRHEWFTDKKNKLVTLKDKIFDQLETGSKTSVNDLLKQFEEITKIHRLPVNHKVDTKTFNQFKEEFAKVSKTQHDLNSDDEQLNKGSIELQ